MADKTVPKSPRGFVGDGAIGLAIVAAMSAAAKPILSPPRSEPIPIVSPLPRDAAAAAEEDDDDEEMSESYTCVISHVAGSAVRKRVYFDDGSNGVRASPGVFFHSQPTPAAPVKLKAMEFLNRCYLCTKWLHGLDIFIYRGDKAFCSLECRCQQILNDEYMEKCSSEAMKLFKYSVSPCSTPLLFAAGVAAA